MELRLFLDIIKRRAWVIVIVAAVATVVVIVAGRLVQPVYSANATVRVLLDVGVAEFNLLNADYNARLLNTYANIVKTQPILEKAISLQAPQNTLKVGDLREQLKVEIVPNTELISIVAQNENPAMAQSLANTLATLLTEYSRDFYTSGGKSARQIVQEQVASAEAELRNDRQQYAAVLAKSGPGIEADALARQIKDKEDAYNRLLSQYETARLNESLRANSVTIIAPAALPQVPINRLGLTQIGLGLIVGMFAGLGLALILENLDTHIHSPQQLEVLTKLPVLGVMPKGLLSQNGSGPASKTRVIKQTEEAYRLLSANLKALRGELVFNAILITSSAPEEGKSTVAANLALTFSESGETVFLVEGDVRRPSLGKMLGIGNGKGLTNLLDENTPLAPAVNAVGHTGQQNGLTVILSGPKVPNPAALFASQPMADLLSYLSTQSEVVVLDAPPVLGVADASVLARRVDGVIFVVRESTTGREQLLAALKQLQASRARVLGMVFIKKNGSHGGYGYY